MAVMDAMNPLFIKNSSHLTAEESSITESFNRRMELRLTAIRSRCNFFEIYRNQELFDKQSFNELVSQSLAKTPDTQLPPEFKDYVSFVQKYESENPGNYYIAKQFGQRVAGV